MIKKIQVFDVKKKVFDLKHIFYSGIKCTENDWVQLKVKHYPLQNTGACQLDPKFFSLPVNSGKGEGNVALALKAAPNLFLCPFVPEENMFKTTLVLYFPQC